MHFTADQVWGCAVAADRLNGGYHKEDQWVRFTADAEPVKVKTANKTLVKEWLRNGMFQAITEADIEQGRVVRHYFKGLLLKELAGKLNDFERQALKIAQMDDFFGYHLLEFAVISCLPASMRREQERKDLATSIAESTQLAGNEGDRVQGEVEVVKCAYSQIYNKYKVSAKLGDGFVQFWTPDKIEGTVKLRGRIKSHRVDNTTQLNYVKIIG